MDKSINYHIQILTSHVENKMWLHKDLDKIHLKIQYSTDIDCQDLYNDDKKYYELNFNYDFENFQNYNEIRLLSTTAIEKELCCNSRLISYEVINTKHEGILKNIFILSKSLELLLCVLKCETVIIDKCNTCKFLEKPYEKEKIYKAKEILLQNLNNPPIIPDLAKLVGINQCYLKKGFKDIFDTTIFAFVQEQRIAKATHLLRQTKHSISEISDLVGFSNPSNFTNSFKAITGILPSQVRNN
ncbi:MAG: helix-turn-helix transcriptional regulator [Saprospiraceae bacterium]|nr:helix-turn-helix transcriptional regulator [Saprospiraceae bacterium]